jgi:hypothetical protein
MAVVDPPRQSIAAEGDDGADEKRKVDRRQGNEGITDLPPP